MGQSYKDTAQSIFLFVFLVFMVNVFLNRTVSNFSMTIMNIMNPFIILRLRMPEILPSLELLTANEMFQSLRLVIIH